jgi:AICAR transformylase/IMP cyclohydrolase PurH
MDHGIEIYLNQLNTVEVAADGKTVTIGGGTMSKKVTDTLWAANKQTGTFSLFIFRFHHGTNYSK